MEIKESERYMPVELMRTSESGKGHLIIDEGTKTKAYKDSRGIWTIGNGFTMIYGRPVVGGDVLTVLQIKAMLPEILKPYEDAVNTAIKVKIYQYEFDALVCFCYNIGINGFSKSEVVRAINDGNKNLALLCFFNWRNPPEIVGRRYADARLFLMGDYLK